MAVDRLPKVSVIIPNYNHAAFLAQRLDTVFFQSFKDIEIIYLDDASTDNSSEVFSDYSEDSRCRSHINSENSGSPFKQWNKGLELATGEYIWIAESDDFSDLGFLKKTVQALDENPDANLVYCQSWMVTPRQDTIVHALVEEWYKSFDERDRWKSNYVDDGTEEVSRFLIFKNTIPNASAVLFRRAAIENGLRAPENMRLVGDWMFWVELLIASKVVYLSEPMNYFRDAHSGSQRNKTEKHGLEMMEGLDVYNVIAGKLDLDDDLKEAVLFNQVKHWATLSCSRRLSWSVNNAIYRKILDAHPGAAARKFRKVFIPFVFYYLSVPLNRVWIIREPYRLVKRVFLSIRGNSAAGQGRVS